MKLLAVVRLVPDSRATLRVAGDGRDIDRAGVAVVCNPFDEFAVEQGVRLREARPGPGELVVLTVGPPAPAMADQAARQALAMGADRAIYIQGACGTVPARHDELYLARVMAAAVKRDEAKSGPFNLILCGKQAIDNDAGDLGPALAEFLDRPHVGAVSKLELNADGTGLRATRRADGAEEVVDATMPALLTCEKGLVEPRYPSLPNIMKAKKKPLEIVSLAELKDVAGLAPTAAMKKLSPPPERPACRMIAGEPPEMARELVRLLRQEAKVV